MKVRPYMIALTFGDGPEGRLHVLSVLAPAAELACAHAVSAVVQMLKVEQPLTRVIWQELKEEFLVDALKGLRGEAGDTKVVSLRAVESEPAPAEVEPTAPPACEHEWRIGCRDNDLSQAVERCLKCGEIME